MLLCTTSRLARRADSAHWAIHLTVCVCRTPQAASSTIVTRTQKHKHHEHAPAHVFAPTMTLPGMATRPSIRPRRGHLGCAAAARNLAQHPASGDCEPSTLRALNPLVVVAQCVHHLGALGAKRQPGPLLMGRPCPREGVVVSALAELSMQCLARGGGTPRGRPPDHGVEAASDGRFVSFVYFFFLFALLLPLLLGKSSRRNRTRVPDAPRLARGPPWGPGHLRALTPRHCRVAAEALGVELLGLVVSWPCAALNGHSRRA